MVKKYGSWASIDANNVAREMESIREKIAELNIPADKIFNFDETAFFYRYITATRTIAGPGDDGAGSVPDKIRITALLTTNATVSRRCIHFVGKTHTPKNTNSEYWERIDGSYFSNGKSWVTQDIFKRYLEQLNNSLK